jgi:hypothetical protein
MFKSGFLLDTPEKIAAAIFNRTPVDVWQNGEIVDYGGVIELQTEGAVKINGSYYLKENHEFRIR